MVGAQHPAPPAGQIPQDRADQRIGDCDRDRVDGFEQADRTVLGGVAQGECPRHLEGHIGGIDAVGLAVDQCHPQVDHGIAGADALLHLCRDTLLDAGDELSRNGAADDLVDELETGSLRERFDLDIADRVLAVSAGLLDVAAMALGAAGEGLA